MKKAVNWSAKDRGDDRRLNRLLSFLQETFPVTNLKRIRKHVYEVQMEKKKLIMKGFPTLRKLRLQQDFIHSLKKAGFQHTYQFDDTFNQKPLFFANRWYGFLEYLPPGKQAFFYHTKEQCREGLELLQSFHETTAVLVDNYRTQIPFVSLKDKWWKRLDEFMGNRRLVSCYISDDVFFEIYSWARLSLNGLLQERNFVSQEQEIILHGDVVYHNFLRAADNQLYLLDFDLISIGPAVHDYLQYANRILPYFSWQLDVLTAFKPYKPYLNQRYFLYGLMFPSDILREWNRIIREKRCANEQEMYSVLDLTLTQFAERRAFVHSLYRLLHS